MTKTLPGSVGPAHQPFRPVIHPHGILFTARVELSGAEPISHLHDLIHTVTRLHRHRHGVLRSRRRAGDPVGKRSGLVLHTGHVDGLAGLLRHAVGTIGARSPPGGGQCFHCEGTGRARPLWA